MTGWLQRRERFTPAIAALAVLAGCVAAVLHLWLFDRGSLNADEVAYVLQAESIARGELFLDVRQPAEAHQPWFFVEGEPGFVSKYLPLMSAFLALGLVAVGSIVPVLAVFAAAVPVVVAALARQLGFDRPMAFAAAAVTSLSPVVLVESALPLSYVPFLALIATSWLLVVRIGCHRSGPLAAAALAVVAAAAACLRPYDAVLLVVPGVLWAGYRRRRELSRLAPAAVLGGLPPAAAIAAYNAEATGSPLRLPFALLEPSDGIGFGQRRLAPEYDFMSFTPLHGLTALVVHFGLGLLLWMLFGLVLVPAAIAARRRAAGPQRLVLVLAVVHLAGYALFWGPWNISLHWGGANRVLGPVYAMPVLALVALAGLPVVARWRATRHRRRVDRLLALGAVLAVAQLGFALWQASVDRDRTAEVLAVAERSATVEPVLLGVDPPYLGHPVTGLVDGFALAAAHPVPPADAPAPRLLQLPDGVYGSSTLSYVVSEQQRVEAGRVPLEVRVADQRAEVLVVERAGRTSACPVTGAVAVVVTPSGHEGCTGAPVPGRWERDVARHCPDTSCLVVAAYRERSGEQRRMVWRRLPVVTDAGEVALLVDGDQLEANGKGWLRVTSAPTG